MEDIKLSVAGTRDQGLVRQMNQDNFLANRQINIYAVADGVESAPFGEVASKMAVEALDRVITEIKPDDDITPPFENAPGLPLQARALKYAIREVNRSLYQYAHDNPKYAGMGTTLTALWISQGRVFIGHVGDSRAYLIRKKIIQQLTSDHTSLSEKHPERPQDMELYEDVTHTSEHELSRAVGINRDVQIQLAGGAAYTGDYFVICTDGLYGQLRDFEISEIVVKNTPQLAARKLIQTANQRGGKDNIALVVIQIE
jgi:PPM family protein phosphatase